MHLAFSSNVYDCMDVHTYVHAPCTHLQLHHPIWVSAHSAACSFGWQTQRLLILKAYCEFSQNLALLKITRHTILEMWCFAYSFQKLRTVFAVGQQCLIIPRESILLWITLVAIYRILPLYIHLTL